MQRRRPNIIRSSAKDLPFSLSDESHFIEGGFSSRNVLRYGSLHKTTFSFVKTIGYLGTHFEILISDVDHKREIDRVSQHFNLPIGETDENLLRLLSDQTRQNVLMVLRQNINQGIRVIGPELDELDTNQRKTILSSELIVNVTLSFKVVERDNIRYALHSVNNIEVLAVNGRYMTRGDLPDLGSFMQMTPQQRLEHYRQHTNRVSNRLGDYVLIYIKEGEKYHVVERSQTGLLTDWILVPTNEAFKMLNDDPESTDLEDERFHYRVVLTYSDVKYYDALNQNRRTFKNRLMESAREYLASRHVDVRGLWYDEGREDRRSHINLHVASELPKHYFSVLFDSWARTHGLAWCDRLFEPLGWRVYASRNHHLLGQTQGKYVTKKEIYKALFGYLNKVLKKGRILNELPLEIVYKIMDYIMIWNDPEKMIQMMEVMSF